MNWDSIRTCLIGKRSLAMGSITIIFAVAVFAQNSELQQKVAEVKQAAAANKRALAQYTWAEQVTVSLKGEQKKQEHFQVRMGPDGKPQKQSLDPPQEAAAPSGGRLKQHVVAKKKDEYKDYVDQIKALMQQYLPPEKEMIEKAAQGGNIAVGPAGDAPGQYRLVLSNYIKQAQKTWDAGIRQEPEGSGRCVDWQLSQRSEGRCERYRHFCRHSRRSQPHRIPDD